MNNKSKYHVIWWWIAWLTTAVYLIQEWKVKWEQISIYEKAKRMWWALDARDSNKAWWYIMRWVRMFDWTSFTSTYDIMSRIPELNKKHETVKDKYTRFNKKNEIYFHARLLKNKKALDQRPLKLNIKDKIKLMGLLIKKEKDIENIEIQNYFSKSFIKSNFRYEFSTVFAFQPWSSLIEFKRYILRFLQNFPYIDTLKTLDITPYNQYDSLILPIIEWLKKEWVNFENETKIINLDFNITNNKKSISKIIYKNEWKDEIKEKKVEEHDYIFITIWSMVANSSIWTMIDSPKTDIEKKSNSWTLWEKIAVWNPDFWNPQNFSDNIEKSRWTSFTISFKWNKFLNLIEKYSNKKETTYWWFTIIDSNWMISLVIYFKPHFSNQPENITIWWGYWLSWENKGKYVKKKMSECNWKEILTELIYELWFEEHLDEILKTSNCIPCSTPYVTSQFLPRKISDRPLVVPKTSINFAFIWQFCEIPEDVVFTVDYSIRSAETAVYKLLNLNKKVTPIYKWYHNPKVLYNALKTLTR